MRLYWSGIESKYEWCHSALVAESGVAFLALTYSGFSQWDARGTACAGERAGAEPKQYIIAGGEGPEGKGARRARIGKRGEYN